MCGGESSTLLPVQLRHIGTPLIYNAYKTRSVRKINRCIRDGVIEGEQGNTKQTERNDRVVAIEDALRAL
jgi:hypothetical protein